jgi:hypothetical protein
LIACEIELTLNCRQHVVDVTPSLSLLRQLQVAQLKRKLSLVTRHLYDPKMECKMECIQWSVSQSHVMEAKRLVIKMLRDLYEHNLQTVNSCGLSWKNQLK